MKVIDLLNKIAKGEKLPRKLKGKNHTYTGIEDVEYRLCNYQDEDGDILFSDDYDWCNETLLNEELEIIEEKPRKIEECKNYECFEGVDDYIEHLRSKTNELQKAVNYLLEKENKSI